MPLDSNVQHTARNITYAIGAMLVAFIALSAAWMVVRERQSARAGAELHLRNFSAVLAEHTRLELNEAPAEIFAKLRRGALPQSPELESFFHRYFSALYGRVELAYGGRIFLFRADSTLLTAFPRENAVEGRNFSDHPLFSQALRNADSGTIESRGIVSPDTRLIAYRRVDDYPLVVAISTSMETILDRSDALTTGIVSGAGVLAALACLATFLLGRQFRTTGDLMREVAENELRLNSIIDSAMDALVTVDGSQKIVLFNAAAERIFGLNADQAIGSDLDRFIPERYRAAHREHMRRFGEAGVTTRRMGADLVLTGLRANGQEFPIDASISHATVAGHKLYTVILRDVTERQRALETERRVQLEHEESDRRLQSIIGSAMDAIITVDEAQHVVLFNAAAEKIFRCSAGDALGAPLERFIPSRYRGQHAAHVKRFGEAGLTMRRMGGELVLAGLRCDGEEFPIDASISHVTVGGQKFYTVILRDITERQRAAEALARSNEELREMYESMHQVREAERTRIARELHDELAQWLTALKMDVSWMRARLPQTESALITKADRMKGVVDSTIGAMRRIAADLRPVMLDDLGLMPAIENLLNDLSERTGMTVRLAGSEALEALREPLVTAVYRMIQEALTNVARHAQATQVAVSLEMTDSRLEVAVRDNGHGLKPDPNRKTFGLLGIRERARTLGGEARIYSPPDGGTVVEITVPLARYMEEETDA